MKEYEIVTALATYGTGIEKGTTIIGFPNGTKAQIIDILSIDLKNQLVKVRIRTDGVIPQKVKREQFKAI